MREGREPPPRWACEGITRGALACLVYPKAECVQAMTFLVFYKGVTFFLLLIDMEKLNMTATPHSHFSSNQQMGDGVFEW
ncbi:hypothetical protein D5086_010107 [Populus alba]|uniref:Uncharacterized protein n=2 Tax=Populus TaxID=3689 RepID=A0ACC4C8F9_POPAL